MVLQLNITFPLKVSRVVAISGLLTFLYCIEFCIGVRTVYYTFRVWAEAAHDSNVNPVSWTLCVACLLTATISALSVNVLSAIWEQKELEEREKEKSAARFAFHIIAGGMIWRYISLWCMDTKEFQKKGALLLTMIKFLFTQTFTVPMVIVHVSVMDHLEEIIYDVCSIFCISVNLILTCTMFSWCSKEEEELKTWDFQTVDLVPLIFQSKPPTDAEQADRNSNISTDRESQSKYRKKNRCKDIELVFLKIIVFLQTFGFSLGRILALGILLKLAGIYAVSIMFLQLLISVIYLKFQAPILVSDSLPKWRQLSRLAFMSYILIFEWHLNRDPKTGYDFSSKVKHRISYYCVASIESVFYLVTWAITTNYYALKSDDGEANRTQNKFCRIILIVGSMSLVFSLTIHIVLLFWRSRKMAVFVSSVRRRYESTKLRFSKYGCGKDEIEKSKPSPKRSKIDISSPIPIKKNDDQTSDQETKCYLEKHNSYRDLREPLDEEIEIHFQKCDKTKKTELYVKTDNDGRETQQDEDRGHAIRKAPVKNGDQQLDFKTNSVGKIEKKSPEKILQPATIEITERKCADKEETNKTNEKKSENSLMSKVTILSGNISEKFGKVSCASKKVAGTMIEQIQKRKEQFQNFRNNSESGSIKAEASAKPENAMKKPKPKKDLNRVENMSNGNNDALEGYFVGDCRGNQEEYLQSVKSVDGKHTVSFSDETTSDSEGGPQTQVGPFPASDVTHKNGDSPCLCYVCKTLGEGRFRRRRSSSMPSADRKNQEQINENGESKNLTRNLSSPIFHRNGCDVVKSDQSSKNISESYSPKRLPKTNFNFNRLSRENSVEHYV